MDHKEEFLKFLKAKGHGPATVKTRGRDLDKFHSFLTRTRPAVSRIEDVTPADVESYQSFLATKKNPRTGESLTAGIRGQYLRAVRDYFEHLVRRGLILMNPAKGLVFPAGPKPLPKDIPTEEEMKAILNAPDPKTPEGARDRAVLELLYSTGLRRSEVLQLQVRDVDLARGLVVVRRGKGGKDRITPLGRAAVEAVDGYLRVRRELEGRRPRSSVYETGLFLSGRGRMKSSLLGAVARRATKKALGRAVSCHKFRHACATHMLRHGANIRMIQELLGHTNLRTTQIYTHVAPVDLKEAHRRHHPRGKMGTFHIS